MSSNTGDPIRDLPLPAGQWFSRMAGAYSKQTGNTTFDIFSDVLANEVQSSEHPINRDSVVHDVAAGPGTAAASILSTTKAGASDETPREILVSDNNAHMVAAANEAFGSGSPQISVKELDAQDLSSLPDGHFTHVVNNFSIFTFPRPAQALRETHRTLQPGGLAVITTWEDFPPLLLIHAAQKRLRPDLPLMPNPGPQFMRDGVLEELIVEEGGFAADKVRVVKKDLVVARPADREGLLTFMCGPFMKKAREGYTEEEEAKWAETIEGLVKDEVDKYGGIRFRARAVLATK